MRTLNPMVELMEFNVHKKLFNGISLARFTLGASESPTYIYIE